MVVEWVDSLVVSLETELGAMSAEVWGIESGSMLAEMSETESKSAESK